MRHHDRHSSFKNGELFITKTKISETSSNRNNRIKNLEQRVIKNK